MVEKMFNAEGGNRLPDFVRPTPVGIKHNLASVRRTGAGSRTCLPSKSRVNLCQIRANLLCMHDGEEG